MLIIAPMCNDDDVAAAQAIETAVFGAGGYPPMLMVQLRDAAGPLCLLARDDGEAIGAALGMLVAGETDGWVLSLAVLPSHAGRGVGRRLLAALLETLRGRGAQRVLLHVDPDNPARRLYERAGFVEIARRADYFGPGADRVIMASEL